MMDERVSRVKRLILHECSPESRNDVKFGEPVRRKNCMVFSVSSARAVDLVQLARSLSRMRCLAFLRMSSDNTRVDVYVPDARPWSGVERVLAVTASLSAVSTAALAILHLVSKYS